MRRVILLALLTLVLPTAALASSFPFDTGTFVRGTASRTVAGGFAAGNLLVNVIGSLTHIRLSTHVLTGGCNVAVGSCTFLTGVVTVLNPHNNAVLFTDDIVNGKVIKAGEDVSIFASLVPNPSMGIPSGGSTILKLELGPNTSLDGGRGFVIAPEPRTLEGLLLGIGVLGLAGMTRRKLKLGT